MFPQNPALKQLLALNDPRRVLAVHRSRSTAAPQQDRLSLNLPWLGEAGRVVLAITGARKREVFEREAASGSLTSPVAQLIAARADRPLDVLWTEQA